MGLTVLRRLCSNRPLLRTRELRLQRVGDRFGNVALDRKNVGQLAIVNVGPKMCVVQRIDQLHIDPHLIGGFLNATL